jgi:hypothetical protein
MLMPTLTVEISRQLRSLRISDLTPTEPIRYASFSHRSRSASMRQPLLQASRMIRFGRAARRERCALYPRLSGSRSECLRDLRRAREGPRPLRCSRLPAPHDRPLHARSWARASWRLAPRAPSIVRGAHKGRPDFGDRVGFRSLVDCRLKTRFSCLFRECSWFLPRFVSHLFFQSGRRPLEAEPREFFSWRRVGASARSGKVHRPDAKYMRARPSQFRGSRRIPERRASSSIEHIATSREV